MKQLSACLVNLKVNRFLFPVFLKQPIFQKAQKKKNFEFPEKMMIVFVFIVQNCYENSRTVIEHLFLWSCYDLQAGPRICLGRDFAYCQMKIMSTAPLQFFWFKLADETKNVPTEPCSHCTLMEVFISVQFQGQVSVVLECKN